MHRFFNLIGLCLLGMLLASCGGNNILTIADTSPSQIDLDFQLSINGGNDSTNYLDITPFQNKTLVAMIHGETMACNGTKLALVSDNIGFSIRNLPLATPITPITCIYSSGAHQANFTVTPLPPPQVLMPQAGATLSYAQSLTITYVAANGTKIGADPYVQNGVKTAGGKSGPQILSGGFIAGPDSGSITLTTHGFHAGQGFIQMKRFMDFHVDHSGFRSFSGGADSTSIVPVTWV